MNIPRRHRAAVTAAIFLALTAAACTGAPDSNRDKEKPLETKREADAVALVRSAAEAAATTVGGPLENWSTVAAPCEGRGGEIADDGPWNLSGHAQIPLSVAQHRSTLEKLRDDWQRRGYEVTEFRTFSDGATGTVAGRTQPERLSVSLESTAPPTALTLLIITPCYMPADGESPGR